MTDPINPSDFGAVEAAPVDPAQFGGISSASIDRKTGASWPIRASVGISPHQDKLTTLQQYYPDAQPFGEGNFVFTDPDTQKLTLYNPQGLEFGDIEENKRMIFEALGAEVGALIPLVAGQAGPQVATPEELVTVPAGMAAGAAIGGKIYDVFAPAHVDTTTATQKAISSTVDAGVTLAGGKLGEMGGEVIKKGLQRGKGALVNSADLMKAFGEIAAKPTAGLLTGSRTVRGIEAMLSKLPGSADVYGKKYDAVIDGMRDYAVKTAEKYSKTEGKEAVGTQIRAGVDSHIRTFSSAGKELYDEADRLMGNPKVQPTALQQKVSEIKGLYADDPAFAEVLKNPLVDRLFTALEQSKGEISYSTLKALRTKIGDAINFDRGLVDADQATLKQIYGALTDDMQRAAAESSTKGASEAMKKANDFWKAGRTNIDDVLWPMVRHNEGYKIYNTIFRESQNAAPKVQALRDSLPEADWNAYKAQLVRDMGLATPGKQNLTGDAWSPSTFLTNYVKLKKSGAADVIFDKKLSKSLDALGSVAQSFREMAEMGQTPGTAPHIIQAQLLFGVLGGAGAFASGEDAREGFGTGVAAAMAPWVAAKFLTSPKLVDWLADSAKIQPTYNGMASHIGRLYGIAEANPELQDAVYQYMVSLRGGANETEDNRTR